MTKYSEATERANEYVISELSQVGHRIPGSTDTWDLERSLRFSTDPLTLDSELADLNLKLRLLKRGRFRLRNAVMKLNREAVTTKYGMNEAGWLALNQDPTLNKLRARDLDTRIFKFLNDLRNCDPDSLSQVIGGYETELLIRTFGWIGFGESLPD